MDQRFHLQHSQKQVLSPQIRQYFRLLQIPRAELEQAIQAEMAENPLLEEDPRAAAEEVPLPGEAENDRSTDSPSELQVGETFDTFDRMSESLQNEWDGDDLAKSDTGQAQKLKDFQDSLLTNPETLADFLFWQAGLLDLSPSEQKIMAQVIGNIDESGYLKATPAELAAVCGVPEEAIHKIIARVKAFDPPGVGAQDLREALLLQLDRKGPEAGLARAIIADHIPLLEKRDFRQLAKLLETDLGKIQEAVRQITSLDPKPGRAFYTGGPTAITPDASVVFSDDDSDKLKIEIHDEPARAVRINAYYRKLLRNRSSDEKTKIFIREKLQAALNFMKALELRGSTLREITNEIVKVQSEFFRKGFSHLMPLRLKDVANTLGIHESTVSRAIQGKYIATPQGTIPYKSFFSTRLETTSGEAESQKSIQEAVRRLIQQEDPLHPLSDQDIAEQLAGRGIKIARRTVAKYREMLKILPTHLRKQR